MMMGIKPHAFNKLIIKAVFNLWRRRMMAIAMITRRGGGGKALEKFSIRQYNHRYNLSYRYKHKEKAIRIEI